MSRPRALRVVAGPGPGDDTVTLGYDDRFRRRMAMRSDGGLEFVLDLDRAVELAEGQALELEDGRRIAIRAAAEPLMRADAPDRLTLVRAAWHVGNRHLPCAVAEDSLTLRRDHVIAAMLEGLGCRVAFLEGPFVPEGGAYGHGRTHGHAH